MYIPMTKEIVEWMVSYTQSHIFGSLMKPLMEVSKTSQGRCSLFMKEPSEPGDGDLTFVVFSDGKQLVSMSFSPYSLEKTGKTIQAILNEAKELTLSGYSSD